MTSPLPHTTPVDDHNDEDRADPSVWLILPFILICGFLISVALYHWWNQCKNNRIFHLQHETLFFRGCHGRSMSARNNLDRTGESTRSTLLLRSTSKKKVRKKSKNDTTNVSVYVIPVDRRKEYSLHWDTNHRTGFPQQRNSIKRPGGKRLSSTNVKESPILMQSTEYSSNYEAGEQPHCASCYFARVTSLNALTSHADSNHTIANIVINRHSNHDGYIHTSTPTTECENVSNASYARNYGQSVADDGSRNPCYTPDHIIHTPCPISHLTHGGIEGERLTSHDTPFPESCYGTSPRQSKGEGSSRASTTEPPIRCFSSVPLRIDTVLTSYPNNKDNVLNAFVTYPSESSETHFSDDTSMIPNMGSSNTFVHSSNHHVRYSPSSYNQNDHVSGIVSLKNLPDLVDGMCSSRSSFESSSVRLHSIAVPTHNTISQNEVFSWDKHPLREKQEISRSCPDLFRKFPNNGGFDSTHNCSNH